MKPPIYCKGIISCFGSDKYGSVNISCNKDTLSRNTKQSSYKNIKITQLSVDMKYKNGVFYVVAKDSALFFAVFV